MVLTDAEFLTRSGLGVFQTPPSRPQRRWLCETLHAFDKSAGKLGVDTIDLLTLHQALPSQFGGADGRSGASPRTASRPSAASTSRRSWQSGEKYSKSAAQVMLCWHIQKGVQVIPKSTRPERIAENFDEFDFRLTDDDLAQIDALDTGVRGGPEPEAVTLATFGRPIPDA